jgi:hypothetical protein
VPKISFLKGYLFHYARSAWPIVIFLIVLSEAQLVIANNEEAWNSRVSVA